MNHTALETGNTEIPEVPKQINTEKPRSLTKNKERVITKTALQGRDQEVAKDFIQGRQTGSGKMLADQNTEIVLPYKGDLLHLDIVRKRNEKICTNCRSVGCMRKDGGSSLAMRTSRYKACGKHVSVRDISLVLEEQFEPRWRYNILEDAPEQPGMTRRTPTIA